MFLYYAILFVIPESYKLQFMYSPYEIQFSHTEQILSVLLGLAYLSYCYHLIHNRKQLNHVKNSKLVSWVYRFITVLVVLLVVWAVMIGVNFWVYDFGVATVSYNPLWLAMGIVLVWLGVEVLSNLKFFLLNKSIILSNGSRILTKVELSRLKNKLHHLMKEQKLYTDPNLSLDILANALDIHPKFLSLVLNNYLGKNFYDFVNQYRVEEVKERLGNLDSRNLTIEAIANQSGFKSKSSFNSAFKKQVSMTPREFIKKVLQN